jgi:putative ABC transport system substrate-binding protein
MRRRDFVTLIGGAAVWPFTAQAQQSALPVVGWMSSSTDSTSVHLVAAFKRGLSEAGYVEGQTVSIEYRWAEGHYDRLPMIASELVRSQITALVAVGGTVVALAAKAATSTVPIIFVIGDDPVKAGLIGSLNRPGGNMTGVTLISAALSAKRIELLRDLKPDASTLGILINPANPNAAFDTQQAQTAIHSLGKQIVVLHAASEQALNVAFDRSAQASVEALVVSNDAFFTTQREQITALAARYAIPAIYAYREYVDAGGLISYGPSFVEIYRQVGGYTGRVLHGEKPIDLPVMQPTKFELVINLKTAKALGIKIPQGLLVAADEVIE